MIWLLLVILASFIMLCEVTLQADLQHDPQTLVRLMLQVGGIRRTWRFRLLTTPQGHQLVMMHDGQARSINIGSFRRRGSRIMSSVLRRADKARRYLLTHIQLERLDALLLLRTEDAAHSAILAGGSQALLTWLPASCRQHVRIRVLPEFFRAHSTVKARCIIRFRLGTIILTAGMLLAAWLREQYLTEREATAYGTSHR